MKCDKNKNPQKIVDGTISGGKNLEEDYRGDKLRKMSNPISFSTSNQSRKLQNPIFKSHFHPIFHGTR